MTRAAAAFVVALLALSAVVVAVPTSGQEAYFGVTDVTVSPSTPAPGETALVSIEVTNFQNSQRTIDIARVAIRTGGGDQAQENARIEDLGTLTPGASMTIPLPYRFSREGLHTLQVHIKAEAFRYEEELSYPLTVRVRSEHPALRVRDADRVVGTMAPLNVSVRNGLDADVRDVSVRLRGPDVSGEQTDTIASLPAGETGTLTFDVAPTTAGDRSVTAELSYTIADGIRRSVNTTLRYEAEPLETGLALDTERSDDGAAVRASLTNLGNVPVERLVVTASSGDRTLDRTAVGTLAPDETRRVTLNATDVADTTDVQVEATYRQAGERLSATATETVSSNPATIQLTGIDLERDGDTIHITGSTSNVGLDPASAVVVSVVDTAEVTPAYPGRNYFVGTVPPSDFVSFDVYATITENATLIPLDVTYLRDGVPQRHVVDVPVDDIDEATDQGSSGPSPGPLGIAIGIVVVVAVGAIIVLGWRNYRARP